MPEDCNVGYRGYGYICRYRTIEYQTQNGDWPGFRFDHYRGVEIVRTENYNPL